MVYKFALYITWPKDRPEGVGERFVIGVLGKDPDSFRQQMKLIEQKYKVRDRQVEFKQFDSIKDYTPCHILFVSRFAPDTDRRQTAQQRLEAALTATTGKSVLLVTDSPGFARRGAAINFARDAQGEGILEINRVTAQQQQLEIDPRLLRLATIVQDLPTKN